MRITSQWNGNTLARNQRSPYSRVLRGRHLSDALGVPGAAPGSKLWAQPSPWLGQAIRSQALRVVLSTVHSTSVLSPVCVTGLPRFSTEFTASTKKEKRTKKERKAATTATILTSHYRALYTYKGQGAKRPPPWVEVPPGFAPLPRLEVHGYSKTGCPSGGEGMGSGGRWKSRGERAPTSPVSGGQLMGHALLNK